MATRQLLLTTLAVAAAAAPSYPTTFQTLVTFGDSYTDDGLYAFYAAHNDTPPAPGEYHPVINVTASGGLAWGQYVQQYTGATYIDYAVDGATCSNEIISRYSASINAPFPSIVDNELPLFRADLENRSLFFPAAFSAQDTLFAVWIGTNDLGWGAFLSDSQAAGTTLTDYVECVFSVLDAVYAAGGRRFVVLNTAPLDLAPMYTPDPSYGGTGAGDNQYWANKTLYNETEYDQKIKEYTTSANTMFAYGLPYNLLVAGRWPAAQVSLYDVHSLLLDVYNHPEAYLEPPYNVTGHYHLCDATGTECTYASDIGPLGGFMFYDELHPSNQTDSVIGKEFLNVVAGNSSYGTTYISSSPAS